MSNFLNAFIADFLNNQKAMKDMGMTAGDQRSTLLQAEVNVDRSKTWVGADLVSSAVKDIPSKIGYTTERYTSSWPQNPTNILPVTHHGQSGFVVTNWSYEVQFFDDTWEFIEALTHRSTNYANPKSNYYVLRAFYDQVNGRLLLVNSGAHVIRVYQFDGMVHLFDIGTPQSASQDPTTGRLYDPHDIDILPNGNYVVACYRGTPAGAYANSGYVAEYDSATGAFVQVLLQSDQANGRTRPWDNAVYQPRGVEVVGNDLYVYQQAGDMIGVFDLTTSPLEHKEVYALDSKDGGFRCAGSFRVDTARGEIIFANGERDTVGGVSLADHKLTWQVGSRKLLDNNILNAKNYGFYTPKDVVPDPANPDFYLVADYANGGIQRIYRDLLVDVDYSFTPDPDFQIATGYFPANWQFDFGTNILRIVGQPVETLNLLPDKLAIPMRR